MKKNLYLVVALLMAALLGACSKSSPADATDLLKCVPSDASAVAVVNVKSMLENAGCKVDGMKVVPSDDVKKLVDNMKDKDGKELLSRIFAGDSGVDPSVAVWFVEGYYNYMTGVVNDPDKFKQTISHLEEGSFSKEDEVEVCKGWALIGNRFWFKVDGNIDAKDAMHFAELSESQSFLSNKVADQLCEVDEDIKGWGNIAGMLNTSNVKFQGRAAFQTSLQMVFDDAVDVIFDVEFEKGKVEAEFSVLNSKGKLAKYQFPTQKIDLATIDKIGGTADFLVAIAVPHKMVEAIKKDASGKQPSMLGAVIDNFMPVDGTAALAAGGNFKNCRGYISTNGDNASGLSSLLAQFSFEVKMEEKGLVFSQGALSGSMSVKDLSEYLKGSIGGVVGVNGEALHVGNDLVTLGAFTLQPDGGSVKVKILAEGPDKDENFLLSILKKAK